MMNLKFKLALFIAFVLCFSSVFSYAINEEEVQHLERRGSNEKEFPNQKYYMRITTNFDSMSEKLTKCRFNVKKRTIYCENKESKMTIGYKINYNSNCSYGSYELRNVVIKHSINRKVTETEEVGYIALTPSRYSTPKTIDLTFKNGCTIHGSYDAADIIVDRY